MGVTLNDAIQDKMYSNAKFKFAIIINFYDTDHNINEQHFK